MVAPFFFTGAGKLFLTLILYKVLYGLKLLKPIICSPDSIKFPKCPKFGHFFAIAL